MLTPLWSRWQYQFTAAEMAPPETELRIELHSPSGQLHVISGFWDGGSNWLVRFMPDEVGEWHYRSFSTPVVDGLHGQHGEFTCQRTATDNPLLLHGPVRVSNSGYTLEHHDGTPFFWLGDTVWNGPLLSSSEDWDFYLRERAAKCFNAVQFNVLAPFRVASANAEGETFFQSQDPLRINPHYFQRLDARMDAINSHGFLAIPAMIWALHKLDPGQYLSEADCIRIARYLVARYSAYHLVWILAGDNPYDEVQAERWKRIGRAVFGDIKHAPVTTHPQGVMWPWESWREEAWLDIFGYQSGHGEGPKSDAWIHSGPPSQHWQEPPHRPRINLEPPYEGHRAYDTQEIMSAFSVRRACYYSLLNVPTAGLTYGAHGLWSWHTKPGEPPTEHTGTGIAPIWRDALDMPGSTQMQHLAELFTSLPWWTLRPAGDVLVRQPHEDASKFTIAARSEAGDCIVLYLACGAEITLRLDVLKSDKWKAYWFDPRTGSKIYIISNLQAIFDAPDAQDWLLVLTRNAD